jgi:hypothetical protein
LASSCRGSDQRKPKLGGICVSKSRFEYAPPVGDESELVGEKQFADLKRRRRRSQSWTKMRKKRWNEMILTM